MWIVKGENGKNWKGATLQIIIKKKDVGLTVWRLHTVRVRFLIIAWSLNLPATSRNSQTSFMKLRLSLQAKMFLNKTKTKKKPRENGLHNYNPRLFFSLNYYFNGFSPRSQLVWALLKVPPSIINPRGYVIDKSHWLQQTECCSIYSVPVLISPLLWGKLCQRGMWCCFVFDGWLV